MDMKVNQGDCNGEKNEVIWSCTLEFFSLFHHIKYARVPIALPLLRDFQKYMKHH